MVDNLSHVQHQWYC